jgi:hypothetical protein
MSDRVSKELSARAKSLSDSRECFIEVYIDNQSLFVIVYLSSCLGGGGLTDGKQRRENLTSSYTRMKMNVFKVFVIFIFGWDQLLC